jgi:hypothetical protein
MGNMRSRLCQQLYAPPYTTTASAFTFVLQGDGAKIDTMVCQPALGTDYTLSSIVKSRDLFALSWVHYTNFGSNAPPGKFTYNESALWNVVEKAGVRHLYIPSLYLDSSAAVTSGRDFFGFPKAFGRVDLSATVPTASLSLTTEADELDQANGSGFPRTIYSVSPGAGAGFTPLPNANPDQIDVFVTNIIEPALKALLGNKDLTDDVIELFKIIAFRRAPLVLLKQVPPASGAAQAAYQSYVIAKSTVTKVRSLAWLTGYNVTLRNWHSAPIASSYGLPDGQPVTPLLGFYVDLDAKIETVSETIIP